VWNTHNTVFGWKGSAISNSWFLGPTRVINAKVISITSAIFARLTTWQTNRQTDHATRSVQAASTNVVLQCGHWSNNNCSISRLLDWFHAFIVESSNGTRQSVYRQQTSLRPRCGITHCTKYFLNLSPVNAKLTLLFYVHQYIFLSSATYTVAIVTDNCL